MSRPHVISFDLKTAEQMRLAVVLANRLLEQASRAGINGIVTTLDDGREVRLSTDLIIERVREVVYLLGGPHPDEVARRRLGEST